MAKVPDGYIALYTYKSRVAHAVNEDHRHGNSVAVCGLGPAWFNSWYGTGSQDEYETAEKLPLCRRCKARLS